MPIKVTRIASWLEKHEFIILTVLLLIMLRLPNFFEPYWYGDEGIYLTVGQALRRGLSLYSQIVDHKTPLIYWLAALAGNLISLKWLLFIASLSSLFLFHAVSLRFLGKSWSAKIATLIFVLGTTLPALEGNIANGELILMPFVLAGVWLCWKSFPLKPQEPALHRFFQRLPAISPYVIGAFYGLAILTKVPSGFDFLALGTFLLFLVPAGWNSGVRRRFIVFGLSLIAGAVSMVILSIVYFWMRGDVGSYLDFGLLYNFRYIQSWNSPFMHPFARFLSSMSGRFMLLLLAVGLIYWQRSRLSHPLRFVLVWFVMTFFASFLSLRPYPHYVLQVIPSAALLVGYFIRGSFRSRMIITVYLIMGMMILHLFRFATYPTTAYYQRFVEYVLGGLSENAYQASFDSQVSGTYILAKWIDLHTNPNELIFIWGDEPMVYSLANRSPAVKYTVAFHIESMQSYSETLAALRNQPPKYIIDTRKNPEHFKELYNFLHQRYVLFASVDRAQIYRLLVLE